MTNTILLKEVISKSGLKYKHIAQVLGLTPYGLMKKIANESEFKTTEVALLCDILRISDLNEKERIFFAQRVENKSTKCGG